MSTIGKKMKRLNLTALEITLISGGCLCACNSGVGPVFIEVEIGEVVSLQVCRQECIRRPHLHNAVCPRDKVAADVVYALRLHN